MLGAAELVKVSDCNTIPIRILNPCSHPIRICRRAKLAEFTKVDANISTFELKDPSKDKQRKQETQQHGSSFYDNSIFPNLKDAEIDSNQMTKQLLYKYKNIFASTLEKTVNLELSKLCDWLIVNKLTLNIKKSNFVIFFPAKRK